jgi:DNA-binding CsgD family transcriptional regulator
LSVMIDVADPVTPAVPDAVPSDIETLLRSLVRKLVGAMDRRAGGDWAGDGPLPDGQVLLDVEVGEVRLLALWQARPSALSLLSPREQEIARMVASGHPNKAIASVLEISSWTVASHLRRIFIKLQVSSRAAMVTRLSGPALNELSLSRDELSLSSDEPSLARADLPNQTPRCAASPPAR